MLPLEGVRILDLTMVWAGPYATRLLADMGAEVLKVESARFWDLLRALHYLPPETERPWNKSAYFNHNNRDKRAISLDLSQPAGRELLLRLVPQCDVVIENYRPDVLDRFELGYERLRAVRPDIILVSMPGHGKSGPERDYVTYGTHVEQLAGLVSLTGYEDGPPQKSGISYGDPIAGITAAGAVATALLYRRRTGRGQYIEVAQREALTSLLGAAVLGYQVSGQLPRRMGNRHPEHSPHNVYPCAGEERWITIACRTDDEFAALCRVIGRQELAADARFATAAGRREHVHLLDEAIGAWCAGQDDREATARLQAAGVPAGPVLRPADLTADPHLRARGFWEEVTHAEAGTWELDGVAWRLRREPARVRTPAPLFAEHNDYVYRELLGLSAAEIAQLEASGIISSEPDPNLHG